MKIRSNISKQEDCGAHLRALCTAGILMSLTVMFARCGQADEAEIRDVLTGHLCRCTGYAPIIKAALEAAAELRGEVNREAADA